MKWSLLALVALMISVGGATAQPKIFDPDAVSDAGLARAKANVAAMKQDELRALLNYFAECSDRLRPPSQACRAASIRYRVEFQSERPIDATLTAIDKIHEIRAMVRSQGIAPKSDGGIEAAEEAIRSAVGAALRATRS